MTQHQKTRPEFRSETDERAFWESHDSSEYVDWVELDLGVVRQDGRLRHALQPIDHLGLFRDAAADRGQRPLPQPKLAPPGPAAIREEASRLVNPAPCDTC